MRERERDSHHHPLKSFLLSLALVYSATPKTGTEKDKGGVSDHSTAMRSRKSCRGKGVAKERKVPRRGMGVARLERMRLLEQKGTCFVMEDGEDVEKTVRTKTRAPPFPCFASLPYLVQRFPYQVGVERGALELAWNRGIGQCQFLESSIMTTRPSSLLPAPMESNMDRVYTIPSDFCFTSTSIEGNNMINQLGYTASNFAATTKLQGNCIQTSNWSDTCLDLSLSTAHNVSQGGRNIFQENQEMRGVAAGIPRAGVGLELTETEKRGGCRCGCRCRCSSCTRASEFHCGGESESSSRPSPSLQLTLGLPS